MQTSALRIFLGVLVGAMAGAAVLAVERVVLVGFFDPKLLSTGNIRWWWTPSLLLIYWIYITPIFAFSTTVIGLPVWFALNTWRRGSWLRAVILGAVLAPVFYVLFLKLGLLPKFGGPFAGTVGASGRFSDQDLLIGDAACFSAAGAFAGLTIWSVARETTEQGGSSN
jgi:hypothetical protein